MTEIPINFSVLFFWLIFQISELQIFFLLNCNIYTTIVFLRKHYNTIVLYVSLNTISCESKSNAYYSNLACLKIAQNQSYTSVDTNSLHIKKLMSFIKDLKFSNLMGTDCITITLMIHFFIKKNNNDSFKKDPHTKHRHLDV